MIERNGRIDLERLGRGGDGWLKRSSTRKFHSEGVSVSDGYGSVGMGWDGIVMKVKEKGRHP